MRSWVTTESRGGDAGHVFCTRQESVYSRCCSEASRVMYQSPERSRLGSSAVRDFTPSSLPCRGQTVSFHFVSTNTNRTLTEGRRGILHGLCTDPAPNPDASCHGKGRTGPPTAVWHFVWLWLSRTKFKILNRFGFPICDCLSCSLSSLEIARSASVSHQTVPYGYGVYPPHSDSIFLGSPPNQWHFCAR